ncbi:MAG TPA: hypothetical protein VMH04_23715 [Candidatus Solibacter sp.]|nr:hypothetical protein [Candidatus Solibacter sp.]
MSSANFPQQLKPILIAHDMRRGFKAATLHPAIDVLSKPLTSFDSH